MKFRYEGRPFYLRWLAAPSLVASALLLGALPGSAAATYENTSTLHLPPSMNQLTSFDISFIDSRSHTDVLTDRNNKSLDVFDTQDDRFVRHSDEVFTGLGVGGGCKTGAGPNTNGGNSGGPNGVVIVPNRGDEDYRNASRDRNDDRDDGDFEGRDRGVAWAGDGDSTVKVIDLNTGHQIGAAISTGGQCRADENWYDPEHHVIVIGNPNDPVVFLTFISTEGTPGPSSVEGKLLFDGLTGTPCSNSVLNGVTIRVCHTVAATAGIEQPIFALHHFWVAIGATTENPGGEIAEIDPTTFQRVGAIGVTCGPSGLTFVPPHFAAAACGSAGVQFFDLRAKTTLGSPVPETGGADQIWFANGNVYAPDSNASAGCARSVSILATPNNPPNPPNGPVVGGQTNSCVAVIEASSRSVIAEVQLPAGAGSHSVAADSTNHKIFVPVKDSTCNAAGSTPCPVPPAPAIPGVIPACPVAEEGGCVHDQGVAIIQTGP